MIILQKMSLKEKSFVNNKIVLDLSDSIDNIDNKNSLDRKLYL